MITCYQITCTIPWLSCEQLPYPLEHPRISWIQHRDKSKYPCSLQPINTSFLNTLSLPCHPSSPDSSSGGSIDEELKSSGSEELPQNPQVFDPFFFSGKKWLSTSSCLRLIHSHPFTATLYFFASLFTQHFPLLFFFFFQSSNFRSWVRKLWSLLNNPISNASAQWVTQIPLIWSTHKPIGFLRAENFSLDLCKDTFRSWTNPTKGWKDWFLRVSKTNEVYWGERKIDQCIRLSIADMERNESMLIAASYFWSDTFNACIFC